MSGGRAAGSSGRDRRRLKFMASTALGLLPLLPQARAESAGAAPARGVTEEIYVFGRRDAYTLQSSSLSKLTTSITDAAQSIDTIPEQVLQDRAVNNLNDALRNVPGITIGAGEFKSMGNSPTIRGFVARTDMFLDGIRDYGDYYRDPFNLESIEVLQGPSSILFGRGSTGGVIEQASKLPRREAAIGGTLTFGTDATRRAVVDVNEPLDGLGEGAAIRLTAMGHQAEVAGRDVVEIRRYGFAPSLALGLGTPTRLTLAYYHQTNDDIPDYGIPYFGTAPAAVSRSNFYGFKSDFMHTRTDIVSFKAEHDFSDAFTIENQLRYASYGRDFRFSEPLISTSIPTSTPLAAVNVTRNVNSGNSDDLMVWDQLFGTVRWTWGAVRNTAVVGIEGGHEKAAPEFDNSSGVPGTPLLTPDENQPFTATSTFPRYKTHLIGTSVAPFVVDTAQFGAFEATVGLRWDYFHVDYTDINYAATPPGTVVSTHHIPHTDRRASYRASLAYKPLANGNVYVAFGTSFNPSAEDLSLISSSRSFSLNNADLAPETNKSFEVGSKWQLFADRLRLSGALFRLQKDSARVPDPANVLVNILAGAQRVDGAELRAEGRITERWQLIAGYTYLDSKVTKTTPGGAPVGAPLMNTPKNALTFWSVYGLTDRLEVGGGGRYVSSQETQNAPPIKTVPGFWTFDAMLKYALTPRIAAQVNVTNLTNKFYYDQLHFFHVVPSAARTALFSLNVRY